MNLDLDFEIPSLKATARKAGLVLAYWSVYSVAAILALIELSASFCKKKTDPLKNKLRQKLKGQEDGEDIDDSRPTEVQEEVLEDVAVPPDGIKEGSDENEISATSDQKNYEELRQLAAKSRLADK